MSHTVGIDLSSFAVDLVKLDEERNRAEWVRVVLPEQPKKSRDPAWHRTLALPSLMPPSSWWDDVYLVAVEAPYGTRQPGTNAILNRVVGAILASVPARLREPNTLWLVRPDEWKGELGLKGKPTVDELLALLPGLTIRGVSAEPEAGGQDRLDALAVALYARQVNARALEAA